MDLIYCADGNSRFAQIAIDTGFRYGAQLPNTVYHPPFFVDQKWRKPEREKYMSALQMHRPQIATVLDLETEGQLLEVLEWAEEAAAYAQTVVIIPKVQGIVAHLPRTIAGAEVRLGYSVPTSFAGTELPLWDFSGWPVHLLGGTPHAQMRIARYLNVQSADGNAAQRAALSWGIEWRGGRWVHGKPYAEDVPYNVFADSCHNIMQAWARI